MKRILCLIFAATLLSGCSDPKTAEQAVEDMGMTDAKATGYAFFGCGQDDMYHTGLQAKNT
jgi:PBP1b-binding outer membrane lipoprotein LpoB